MTSKEMESFLVGWFNQNGAGRARGPLGTTSDDVTLVLMAFDLRKLAQDLTAHLFGSEEAKKIRECAIFSPEPEGK